MAIQDLFDKISYILQNIPLNIFDYFFIIAYFIYVFEEAEFGLISSFFNFSSIIISFFLGISLYSNISYVLITKFSLTKGLADAIGFIIVTAFLWVLLTLIFKIIRKTISVKLKNKNIDFFGGALFGTISFLFIYSFIVSLLLSFPVSKVIKDRITESYTGKTFLVRTGIFESNIKKVFGGAIEEALNFLTIKPESNETVKLNFTVSDPSVDPASEEKMFDTVNRERESRNLPALVRDENLTDTARQHAKDMLEKGYFSHYSLAGYSPFDRLEQAGINYTFAAENLAFAPDVDIAMQGLMKSAGHRENILSKNVNTVGIGVIDGGIFGKMFVQEFTD